MLIYNLVEVFFFDIIMCVKIIFCDKEFFFKKKLLILFGES